MISHFSVTFYDSAAVSNNNVIGTATASPWSVQWASVPAGSYSLTAVATNGSVRPAPRPAPAVRNAS